MDQRLLKTARFNTALLAFSFLISTVQAAAAGSLFALIGALATVFTVKDAINLHNAIKGEQDGSKTN